MKKILQGIITIIVLFAGVIGVLYAAGVSLPWGGLTESASNGYLTPMSGQTKDITLANTSCLRVDSTTNTRYFIPTRTAAESAAFTGNLPPGVTTRACNSGACRWGLRTGTSCRPASGLPIWDGTTDIDTIINPDCTPAIEGTIRYITEGEACTASTVFAYPAECSCNTSPNPINGVCGTANGSTSISYPTQNHCSAGSKVDVDIAGFDGTYNWRCNGVGGGSSSNCSATKFVDRCGPDGLGYSEGTCVVGISCFMDDMSELAESLGYESCRPDGGGIAGEPVPVCCTLGPQCGGVSQPSNAGGDVFCPDEFITELVTYYTCTTGKWTCVSNSWQWRDPTCSIKSRGENLFYDNNC